MFDTFCTLFAIEFHVRVDLEAAERMRGIWECERPMYPAPHSKTYLRAQPMFCGLLPVGDTAATRCSREQRSAIAKKAAKARWETANHPCALLL